MSHSRTSVQAKHLSAILVLSLLGCGGLQSQTASATENPPIAVAPTTSDAEAAAAALTTAIDAAQGLVVIAQLEDESDGEAPPMVESGHRCGADVDSVGTLLSEYVASRRASGDDFGWSCGGDRCELRGSMEFDPTRVLRFGRSVDGTLVVTGVYFLDEILVSEESVAAGRIRADASYDALHSACP